MGSLTNYGENICLNHMFGHTTINFANLYVGLATADPGETGSIANEVSTSGTAYARQSCFGDTNWDAAANRMTTNTNTVQFTKATANWGTVSHWFIIDSASGAGNMIAYGSVVPSKTIVTDNTASIAAGQLDISVTASVGGGNGGMLNYLVHALLNLIFRDTVFSPPTVHVALATTEPTDAGSFTEVANSNNYARKEHSGTSNWDTSTTGVTQNNNAITFNQPSGSWGAVTHAVLVTSATYGGGNGLLYIKVNSQTPDNGDTVEIADAAYGITLT